MNQVSFSKNRSGLVNMYQQRERLQLISMISICAAILCGLFGLFKSFHLFIYLSIYCICAAIVAEGVLLQLAFRKAEALKLLILGILLFTLTTFLFFAFLKGS